MHLNTPVRPSEIPSGSLLAGLGGSRLALALALALLGLLGWSGLGTVLGLVWFLVNS